MEQPFLVLKLYRTFHISSYKQSKFLKENKEVHKNFKTVSQRIEHFFVTMQYTF